MLHTVRFTLVNGLVGTLVFTVLVRPFTRFTAGEGSARRAVSGVGSASPDVVFSHLYSFSLDISKMGGPSPEKFYTPHISEA